MKVVVTQTSDTFTITQRYTLMYKLTRLVVWLVYGTIVPVAMLEMSGTSSSLTCVREPAAGVVCTNRMTWLGSFPRAMRYERVEQAYVPSRMTRDPNASSDLHLRTADGVVSFSHIYHSYAKFAVPINAFIAQPDAPALVVRDRPHLIGILLGASALLFVAYQCLVLPLRKGLVAIFDMRNGQLRLHRQGFWRPKTETLPLTEIVQVQADENPPPRVFLTTSRHLRTLCWFSGRWFSDSARKQAVAESRKLAANLNAWLPQNRNRSLPPDRIEVSDPTLAYLLGYSESNAAVTYGHRMHLRLDRLSVPATWKRNIRAALAPRLSGGGWPIEVVARELVAICQIDVQEALDNATPQQRREIEEWLESQP